MNLCYSYNFCASALYRRRNACSRGTGTCDFCLSYLLKGDTNVSLVVRQCLFISQNPCRKGCVRGPAADTSPQPLLSGERSAFLLAFVMATLRANSAFRCRLPFNM